MLNYMLNLFAQGCNRNYIHTVRTLICGIDLICSKFYLKSAPSADKVHVLPHYLGPSMQSAPNRFK